MKPLEFNVEEKVYYLHEDDWFKGRQKLKKMTFQEFKEKFNPLILNESEVGLKQLYVPSTWPEAKVLLAHPTKCIWTIIKEDGKLYLRNDLHFHNKVANIICANICNEPRETYKIEIDEKES